MAALKQLEAGTKAHPVLILAAVGASVYFFIKKGQAGAVGQTGASVQPGGYFGTSVNPGATGGIMQSSGVSSDQLTALAQGISDGFAGLQNSISGALGAAGNATGIYRQPPGSTTPGFVVAGGDPGNYGVTNQGALPNGAASYAQASSLLQQYQQIANTQLKTQQAAGNPFSGCQGFGCAGNLIGVAANVVTHLPGIGGIFGGLFGGGGGSKAPTAPKASVGAVWV